MKNEHFRQAFSAWAASNPDLKSADSHAVYEDMWNVFAEHVEAEKPAHVRSADIQTLLNGRPGEAPRELNQRYQARLVALIDKVLQHDAQSLGHQPPLAITEFLQHNAGVKLAMQRNRKEDEPELVYLSDTEFQRLIAVLLHWPQAPTVSYGHAQSSAKKQPADSSNGSAINSTANTDSYTVSTLESNKANQRGEHAHNSANSLARWQDCRDAASTALQLAAGLSPTDIRALDARAGLAACRSAVNGDAMIWIPGNGKLDERKAPISAWALPLLQRWLAAFELNQLSSEWLFPGRSNAVSAWSKPSQYDVAKTIMAAAGLGHMTSFHLRHTWALRQLAAGQGEQNVARWLGVRDNEVMQRYRAALPKFQQASAVQPAVSLLGRS
jgi:hypothetical protein